MSALPPPPSEPIRWTDLVPAAGPRRRPGLVTASAVLLLISGAFSVLAGVAILAWGDDLKIDEATRQLLSIVGVVSFAIGGLQGLTGVLILLQIRAGRTLGLVLAALGVASALLTFGRGGTSGLIGLALNGLILYALSVHGDAFGRVARGR
ncbi:MAG TPA: hypothetical protein VIE12_03820 [Actinomycetota bacterium]